MVSECLILIVLLSPSPAEAQVNERMSLQGIQQLVHRSCQTLALWKLLCDHQFSLIISELPMVNFQHQ
jgi:nuclear pore complex protein Nup155